MTYQFHVDQRFGHVTVTNEAGTRLGVDHEGESCPDAGYPAGDGSDDHTSSCCYMRTDPRALLDCDVIHLLPGWERSKGAGVELAVAQACGLRVEKHEP